MTLAYAYCAVPVLPLRAEPSHRAEQVSQVLFGEKLEIYTQDEHGWFLVQCDWDGYEGWVPNGALVNISYKEFRKKDKFFAVADALLERNDGTERIPAGSNLPEIRNGQLPWLPYEVKFRGKKINLKNAVPSGQNVVCYAKGYLGTPYLWGGRHSFGIDCSGLSQIVYKLNNIRLPRDASQQALVGEEVSFLQEARAGDLAFFDNAEGRITHVGVLIDNHTIIHATEFSGAVVIDTIDNGGIINRIRRQRSHALRIIRRYIQ